MKYITFLTILLTTVTFSFGQAFEGKITYKNEYKSKMPNVTSDQFNAMMGTTQEYVIKGGNYKSSMNGTFFQWQLYVNKDNKLYSKTANSASIFWNDGAANTDEVITSEINKEVATILGMPCDELVLTCKSGIQKYYFSPTVKADPKLFDKHKFGNWSEIVSRTNALPLKISIDNQQFSLECVATEVAPMKLDEKLFELPPDSKIEKSPF